MSFKKEIFNSHLILPLLAMHGQYHTGDLRYSGMLCSVEW